MTITESVPSQLSESNPGVAAKAPVTTGADSLLACLIVVSRAHGGGLTRDAAIAGLPMGEEGLTPSLFARAAVRGGLSSSIVKQSLGELNHALFPVILLLRDRRACVLLGWNEDRSVARLIFPELGDAAVELTAAELGADYLGRAIYVRPRFRFDARVPATRESSAGHWFWGAIWKNSGLYRDVLVAAALINIFAVAMPVFALNVFDRVIPNNALETLWVMTIGIVVVLVGDLVLRNLRSRFVDLAAARVDTQVSSTIMEHVMGMRMENRPPSAGAFAANLRAFESVRNFLSSGVVVAFIDLPFALLFIGVIYWIAPAMLPIFATAVAAMLAYALVAQRRMQSLSEMARRAGAQRNATLVEGLVGLETIKTLGAEGAVQRRWEESATLLSNTACRLRTVSSAATHVTLWIQSVVTVAVIVTGVYLIGVNTLTMGGLVACYLLSSRAMGPFGRAAGMLIQYHKAKDAFQSVDSVMDREVERPPASAFIQRDHFDGKIAFRNVSFRYPEGEADVLTDISLEISPGEHVAILGRVGSGKSTLEKLILGLYRPIAGEILIDDIDIRQLDPAELRRHIGYVAQDVTLFFGNLRENLTIGRPFADDEAILKAAKIGCILPFANRHPRGFDMQVGERGDRLSGGQRQGVAMARAVLGDPPILVLDEPTSSMDRATEAEVKREVKEFAKGRTMMIVTHRTSLLEMVDRVIVMDQGRIVADGPKDDVVKAMKEGRIRKVR